MVFAWLWVFSAKSLAQPTGLAVQLITGQAQVIGILIGNDRLQEEGQAQQDKADAEKEVAKKEAAAEAARACSRPRSVRGGFSWPCQRPSAFHSD